MNNLGGDLYFDIVDVIFFLRLRGTTFSSAISTFFATAGLITFAAFFTTFFNTLVVARTKIFRRHRRILRAGFINLNRVTIKIRVSKKSRGLPKIHDGKIKLAIIFIDAGATPNDLLKFSHRSNAPIQHNKLASLGINAGAHQLGSSTDNWVGRFGVNKVIELGFAFIVVAGDAHDVFCIGRCEVGIGVNHSLAHSFGMIDIFAKDDGLGKAVGCLEKLRDLFGNKGGTLFENQIPIIVAYIVFTVFDNLPVLVGLPVKGTPANIPIKSYSNDLVRRKVTIGNSLAQRVNINWLAKVFDVGNILGFLGRSGKAYLSGTGEVFENFTPCSIISGTSPMTLIDNNQIEKVWGKLSVNILLYFGACYCLI